MNYWIIALVVLCSVLGSLGQLFFKLGSDPLSIIKLFVGLSFYGLATIGFIYALRHGDLHVLYPIIACSYIFVMLLSWKFLSETITITQWFGAGIIVVGVWMIAK